MIFMHGGHKGHNHGNKTGQNNDHGHHDYLSENGKTSNEVRSLDNYKMKQLEGQIEFLKTQNELLQKEIENFNSGFSRK